MILIALRILFGAGLFFGFKKVLGNEQVAPQTGDLTNAFYLAVCVVLAIANAVVWAPYVGDIVSGPLTGTITRSTYVDRKNHLLRLIHWLENHGFRRLTVFFCFLEGIHQPGRPAPFVIGLKSARPGSWLEKVYALEVFKFDNAQHCMMAYEVLQRRGIDPRPHHNPEVNMVLLSLDRRVKPEPEKISVPPAPTAPPMKRDRRIKLFDGGEPAPAEREPPAAAPGEQPSRVKTIAPITDAMAIDSDGAVAVSEGTPAVLGFFGRVKAFFRGN